MLSINIFDIYNAYCWLYNKFLHFHGILYGFPHGSVVKTLPAYTEDTGSIPWSGRSPREGNGNPLQYSGLENSMDRGAWSGQKESDTTERLSTHAWHSLRDHGSTTPHFILYNSVNLQEGVTIIFMEKVGSQLPKISSLWLTLTRHAKVRLEIKTQIPYTQP